MKCPRCFINNEVATVNFGVERIHLRNLVTATQCGRFIQSRFAAVTLRLDNPRTTLLLFASGKGVITGGKSQIDILLSSYYFQKMLNNVGVPANKYDIGIRNIVGHIYAGFPIDLNKLHKHFGSLLGCTVDYNPNRFPGVIFRREKLVEDGMPLVMLIFHSGSVINTGVREERHLQPNFDWVFENVLLPNRYHSDKPISSAEYRRDNTMDTHVRDMNDVMNAIEMYDMPEEMHEEQQELLQEAIMNPEEFLKMVTQ